MECEGPLPTIHQNDAGLHRASCQTHSPTLIHYAIDSWQWWIEDQQKQLHQHRRVALSPGQFVIGRIRSSVDDLISDSHFNGLFILRGRTSVLTEWRNGGLDDWRGFGSTRRWGEWVYCLWVRHDGIDWRWHDTDKWVSECHWHVSTTTGLKQSTGQDRILRVRVDCCWNWRGLMKWNPGMDIFCVYYSGQYLRIHFGD